MEGPEQALLSVGEVFHGKYEVRRCLQVGGMAVVYEVVHTVTRRPSALKVVLPEVLTEPAMRDRFALEARITSGIESEHIVPVLDAGVDEATGSAFLVMELLRGDDLGTVLRRRGPLGGAEVVTLLAQAALAIDAVHEAGIVHRDLKPSNLFLLEADPPRLKVLDFGIAKVVAAGGATTRNLGTPVYMSPEQARGDGDVGPAADVYALGQVAYALLAGAPYWAEEQARGGRVLFDALEQGAVEPASARARRRGAHLPAAFDAWFARATAVAPEERFATAGGLVAALAGALGVTMGSPAGVPQTPPDGVVEVLPARARRRPPRWMAASLLATALGGLSWAALRATAGPARVDVPGVDVPGVASAMAPADTATGAAEAPDPSAAPAEEHRATPRQARPAPARPGRPAPPASAAPPPGSAAPVSPSPFGTAVY